MASSDNPQREKPSLPFRFSMRTMLIAMTALAVWCAAVALIPSEISLILIGLLSYAMFAFLGAGLLFGQGSQRAFCLGALLVVSSMWTDLGGQFMNGVHQVVGIRRPWSLWTDFLLISLTAAANGWVCVRARRYFERISA